MQKTALIAALAGLVAGCAAGPHKDFYVDGTENMVTVNWANSRTGQDGAMAQADAHCAKYGKRAQFAGNSQDFAMAFNCIK